MVEWYPQGKTSIESRFNIPGAIGWATMESVGFITLLYIMFALPRELGIDGLPIGNWTMAGCFVRVRPGSLRARYAGCEKEDCVANAMTCCYSR